MAYVDLNPIRAKMASGVENSEFTSVFERIHGKDSIDDNVEQLPFKVKPLLGFIGNDHEGALYGIAFSLLDYLNLVEATGKVIRADKKGHLDVSHQLILKQLGINGEDWLQLAKHFGKTYHLAVDSLAQLAQFASHTNKHWISGQRQQSAIFH